MLKTLKISFSLRNTYRVNSILYSLKQIPLLGRLLPSALYQVRGFKIFANILSVLWELVCVFLFKLLYFFTLVCGIYYRSAPDLAFLHTLLFLSLIGSYLNTRLFSPSKDAYYAIILLRMNARSYTLVNYGYALLKILIGFLPFTLLFGIARTVPIWICLLIPFCVVGAKLTASVYSLRSYEKNGGIRTENSLQKFSWLWSILLLILAYLPPAIGIALPFWAYCVLWLCWIPAGLVSVRRIRSFPYYREFNQELLSQLPLQMESIRHAGKSASEKAISSDTTITSRKKGFEYLNELFVRRHRKILWKSALRIAAVLCVLCCGALLTMIFLPETRPRLNQMVLTWLPYFAFIMYLINRGTGFTQALFMNCDHSLLTYSFYKQPHFVLRLFRIRLREIMKINAVPALVIGVGLALILYASGGTQDPLNYLVLIVSILAMSLFFSTHYLTLYYLLQPYTAGTELKSGTYRIAMTLTYVVCYVMMNLRLPTLAFGAACIVFCAVYSAVACLLVYKLAPRTFRIRS